MVDALPANAARGAWLRMVAGEAGVGKTRLVRELVDRAVADGHRVVWGQCWDEAGTPPYWPWTQVVRQLRGVRTGVDLASLVLDGFEGFDEADRFLLFDAVAAELDRAATEAPLVVVLDDLHHSDPLTLLLARFVLAHLVDTRLLVVATYRPDDAAARSDISHDLDALREVADVIELVGLDLDAVSELVGDPATAAEVQAVTGGNPLFVDQVVRAGRAAMPTGPGADGAGAHRDALLAALTSRIEQIDPDVVELLASLAVLGPRAGAQAASTLLDTTVGRLRPVVLGARSAGLVDPDGWSLSHPLVAEALAALVPEARLEALHLAASRLSVGDALSPAERAHHLCRAGPAQWKAAVTACCDAARVATESFAHDDAVAHYQRAAALVAGHPDDTVLAFEVTLALACALERAEGRLPDEHAYERAVELARRSGDPALVARAAARHGITFYTDGSAHRARGAECRAALSELPGGDSALRARLLANLAASHIGGGDSARLADDVVAMARRVADPEALGIALVA